MEQEPALTKLALDALFGHVMSADEIDERARHRGHRADCAVVTQTRSEYNAAPAGCTCSKPTTSFGSVAEGPAPDDRRTPRPDPAGALSAWFRTALGGSPDWDGGLPPAPGTEPGQLQTLATVEGHPTAFIVARADGTVIVVHTATIALGPAS